MSVSFINTICDGQFDQSFQVEDHISDETALDLRTGDVLGYFPKGACEEYFSVIVLGSGHPSRTNRFGTNGEFFSVFHYMVFRYLQDEICLGGYEQEIDFDFTKKWAFNLSEAQFDQFADLFYSQEKNLAVLYLVREYGGLHQARLPSSFLGAEPWNQNAIQPR